MLYLILKDILIQKKIFIFGIFYILILILSFQGIGNIMFSSSIIAFAYILVQSACAYDDKSKSDIMLNSLPISRNTIVTARYVSTFIFAAIAVAYYVILTNIIKISGLPLKVYPITLEEIVAALFAITLLSGIYFPVFFKFGYIKSRVVNIVLFFGLFFGLGILLPQMIKNMDKEFAESIIRSFINQPDILIAVEILAVIIGLLVISYILSLKFYKEREF